MAAAAVSPQLILLLMLLTAMRHQWKSEQLLLLRLAPAMAQGSLLEVSSYLPEELALSRWPANSSFNTISAFADSLEQQHVSRAAATCTHVKQGS